MIILRTAGEVDAFLATPLGRQTEPILAPHMERLAEFGFEDFAAIAIREAVEPLATLGLDPEGYEYQDDHQSIGFREEVHITGQDGSGWIVLTRL
jgi:hypothetical protein